MADRERVGRGASPSAAIIDSQSVKTTEAGGPRGYDAGKKINGRKRHALVDTDGRGLMIEPGPSFTPLPSCCSHAASQGTHEFRNRLLDRSFGRHAPAFADQSELDGELSW